MQATVFRFAFEDANMKILYIAREFGESKTGANQVMGRNLDALRRIVGRDNVIECYFPKTTMRSVAMSMACLGSYGVSCRDEQRVVDTVLKERPDFAFLEGSMFGGVAKRLTRLPIKTILFAHNVDSALSRQEIASRSSIIGRAKFFFVRYNEQRSVRYSDAIICLSERDSMGFDEWFGRKADIILPITFPDRVQCDKVLFPWKYLLFVGSDFFPNIEGVKWFIEEVAPYIGCEVRIVGGCCGNPALRDMELPGNVTLAGYVDDLDDEYINASAVVAPIFKGSGMKTKTVEAMSYGKTILGTDEAFAGIECDYDKIGARCNTADEFISAINSSAFEPLNQYTLDLFHQNFSNDSFTERLSTFLKTF